MNSGQDTLFMKRALTLAAKGRGRVSPNPMVGAVIVFNDQIIGEGYHTKYGMPHAEVEAIKSVTNQELLAHSTLYVNLEPCSHYGKTPPCADLIYTKQIPRVVIAMQDPNPIVSGRGIEKLITHGVDVSIGVLESEALNLNKRFIINQKEHRPYIILKWAQTLDGYISTSDGGPLKISNSLVDLWVHQWRSEEDSILVGRKTVELDNPQLTVRNVRGRNPVRIIIDPELKLDNHYKIFQADAPTWIVNRHKNEVSSDFLQYVSWRDDEESLKDLLNKLLESNIGSILIEGGTKTLNSFIEAGVWDEYRVTIGSFKIDAGLSAPTLPCIPIHELQLSDNKILFGQHVLF